MGKKKSYFCGSKGQIVLQGSGAVTNRGIFPFFKTNKKQTKKPQEMLHTNTRFLALCRFKPLHCDDARQQGFFLSYAVLPSIPTATCLSSHASLVMTWLVEKVWMPSAVGVSERQGGGATVRNEAPQLPLFSPQSPGQHTPAGTHLIIHPVRVPRSKLHSDKFRLTICKVLRKFFLAAEREMCFFLCVFI